MAHDVFISYSSKNQAIADDVCATLESRGVGCWVAPRDIEPSKEWSACIIDGIQQSRILVLIFTAEANASPQIHREVELAVNRGVAILPLRVENVMPGAALEYFMADVQWLDALTLPIAPHLTNLAGTLKTLLAGMPPRDADAPVVPMRPAEPGSPQSEMARASQTIGDKPAPAAEIVPGRVSSSFEAASAVSLRDTSAATKKHWTRRIWVHVIVVGAAALITLVLVAYFLTPIFGHWTARQSGTSNLLRSGFSTGNGSRVWAVGDGGTILVSDNGKQWNRLGSGTTNDLHAIFGTSDGSRLWAVGDAGTIVQSNDGENWTVANSGASYILNATFEAADGKRRWAFGQNGTILASEDGAPWNAVNSGTSKSLWSVFGTADGSRLWVCGDQGTILKSDDGVHWNVLGSGTSDRLRAIFGTSDGKRLWAVGMNGTILESDDGQHWAARDSGTPNALTSIFGTSDGRLWVVGENGTILESSDGQNWNAHKSGTTNWLLSVFGASNGRRLWAVGGKGTILQSDESKQ